MQAHSSASRSSGFDARRLQRVSQWLDRQVADNRLKGASVLIGKSGEPSFFHAAGEACVTATDVEQVRQVRAFNRDTIVRLYSMTKPVTNCAAMMLFEQGCFALDDPVAMYLPAFAEMRVWAGSGDLTVEDDIRQHTQRADSLMTVRQLMTHTAGLSYGFMNATPVDKYYREHGLIFPGANEPLDVLVDRLAQAPLLCQPGTQWNYSVASDVLGRLVELWSSMSLAEFFRLHIFEPLAMHSTGFYVQPDDAMRFADLFGPAAGGELGNISGSSSAQSQPLAQTLTALDPPIPLDVLSGTSFLSDPPLYSGGGGLVGSADDYARFCQCLLNGGVLDGVRILGRKTVEFMRQNQLPENRDMAAMGQAVWSETTYKGIGFGLGFAVVLDPVKAGMLTSPGEHHWGGAASTFFWIDPLEELYVILLTQLYPSSTYPLRSELRTAVYQALQ